MKFGIRLPVTGPFASKKSIRIMAEHAESLGFDAVTTHDHVFYDRATRYHNAGGLAELVDIRDKLGLPVTDVFESITVFSYVAGFTERIQMIPCALVLPWRHPTLLAKQAITLDKLSEGRFTCLVCIGNIPSDFDAMGVDFHERGKIMDEYIQILKQIFSTGEVEFKGKYITIPDLEFFPKPTNLSLWYAGSFKPVALERTAKFADGFFTGGSPEEFEKGLPKLRSYLRKFGRKEDDIEIGTNAFLCLKTNENKARKMMRYTIESFYQGEEFAEEREKLIKRTFESSFIGSTNKIIQCLERYKQAGVEVFDLRINSLGLDDTLQMIRRFAHEIIPSFC